MRGKTGRPATRRNIQALVLRLAAAVLTALTMMRSAELHRLPVTPRGAGQVRDHLYVSATCKPSAFLPLLGAAAPHPATGTSRAGAVNTARPAHSGAGRAI